MPKTKRSSSNSNLILPKSKQFSTGSKKSVGQQNGHLDLATLRSLKREYLAAETKETRAKLLKPIPQPQRRELILKWYRSLRTGKAEDQFLSLLSSEALHTLMWDMTYESHQNGSRLI